MSKSILNHNVLFIEPIIHPEFLCHIVSQKGRTYLGNRHAEYYINQLLIECFAATIASRKINVKHAHKITRLIPIIIDDSHDFVMFPLHACKYKNAVWINLRHVMKFEKKHDGTSICFQTGDALDVSIETHLCENQYRRALEVLDYFKKYKHLNISYTIE